jgi:hypothetical protein
MNVAGRVTNHQLSDRVAAPLVEAWTIHLPHTNRSVKPIGAEELAL